MSTSDISEADIIEDDDDSYGSGDDDFEKKVDDLISSTKIKPSNRPASAARPQSAPRNNSASSKGRPSPAPSPRLDKNSGSGMTTMYRVEYDPSMRKGGDVDRPTSAAIVRASSSRREEVYDESSFVDEDSVQEIQDSDDEIKGEDSFENDFEEDEEDDKYDEDDFEPEPPTKTKVTTKTLEQDQEQDENDKHDTITKKKQKQKEATPEPKLKQHGVKRETSKKTQSVAVPIPKPLPMKALKRPQSAIPRSRRPERKENEDKLRIESARTPSPKKKPSRENIAKLKAQNASLKAEIRLLRQQVQGSVAATPLLGGDGAEFTHSNWTYQVPTRFASPKGSQTPTESAMPIRPGSAGFLFEGVVSKHERQMWLNSIRKPSTAVSGSKSGGRPKSAGRISRKKEMELREACWDKSVKVESENPGSLTPKLAVDALQKNTAAKTTSTSKKKSKKKTMKLKKKKVFNAQTWSNTKSRLLSAYGNAIQYNFHRPSVPKAGSKSMKRGSKLGDRKKKIHAEFDSGSQEALEQMDDNDEEVKRIRKQLDDLASQTRPAYLEEEDDENSKRQQQENAKAIVDWTCTPLFLQSSERLKQARAEHSQMDQILLAIDCPENIVSSFETGMKQLEALWEDLQVKRHDREIFRERYFASCTTGNYAHVLSQVTRLTSLRNKLLHVFQMIKKRERLVEALSKVLNVKQGDKPHSPRKINEASNDMATLRNLNENVANLIQEIQVETSQPLILHGMNYLQKIKYDLVI